MHHGQNLVRTTNFDISRNHDKADTVGKIGASFLVSRKEKYNFNTTCLSKKKWNKDGCTSQKTSEILSRTLRRMVQ